MQEINDNLKVSKIFLRGFTIFMAASLIMVSTLSISITLKICIFIGLIFYSIPTFRRHVFLTHKNAIVKIKLNFKECVLTSRHHTFYCEIAGDTTLTQFVCILRFKAGEGRFKKSCIIFKDSLPEGQYRRLIVILKGMKLHSQPGQNALPSAAL